MARANCPGSGEAQWAAFPPVHNEDEDYPGAGICSVCSLGVLFRKNTVREAVYPDGKIDTFVGRLKTHKRPK